ncbi:restriction endonuclease [Arcobacter cryaerophilus gv. occultus]|uniref:Eco57I restriction-modification methylase domain-containing protein n=1 Tax=Aliarcobacter cryaerophilus TaxID=28198 RepID=UPI000D01CA3F|nr:Eco57I restriction-modification methylase domain-containing protein [Aliarcobacter cryaerophilus]PRM91238.1 restriction endonuclease [Arcobacter cryaerophilus gv. occultus]
MSETITIDVEILNEIIIGRVDPQIYAFTTETVPNYLKVGDTYRPLEVRLSEWKNKYPNLTKVFDTVAKVDNETFFRDHAIHNFLEIKGRTRLTKDILGQIDIYYSKEFFKDATKNDLEEAIIDIKDCYNRNEPKYQYYKFEESHIPITHIYSRTVDYEPRPNQKATIDKFKEVIAKNEFPRNLLMYAVMRFGKSFTSMCCAIEMNAKFVVVVSAKADVKNEWKQTVESHVKFNGYYFLDSEALLHNDTVISDNFAEDKKIVLFLTLQDLQGEEVKSKHKEVFENQIDLLLIDESHFGARASEYGKVLKDSGLSKTEIKNEQQQDDNTFDDLEKIDDTIKELNSKIRIHLSGTPYRILMDSEFTDDDIIAFYQFTDIAEDQKSWDTEHLNKDDVKEWENPYYGFPQMIRFAFNPNKSSQDKMEELKKRGITYAFSELFRPLSIKKDTNENLHKKFKYENEIIDLLKVIDGSQVDENLLSFLNYDKIKDGQMCRHLVCVLPYRASCDALEKLINTNEFRNLSDYEIINISGVEDERTYKKIEDVQNKIKNCENENKKTITLTVNKMLTGSTVPQWDTMLYFKDTASPQEYDQAIFRLQNQYIKTYKDSNGDEVKYNMKPQTLLVDFNPDRMYVIQEQKSQIYNVNTDTNGNSQLEERIKKELEISPIIVLNHNKMEQITPSNILDAVRQYSSTRSVFDEATTIAIDYSLLNIPEIKAVIEKQGKIGSRQGLEIEATEDEGTDIEVEDDSSDDTETTPTSSDENTNTREEENIEDYKGQFAMYYARILFFAFLTDSQIKSLRETIDCIGNNANNSRILSNLNLDIEVLKLFQEHINPFILRELDYKIQNINSLANDTALEAEKRASNALKKFSRLSDSEVVTPESITQRIVDILPSNIATNSKYIIDLAAKQGEFVYAIYKKYGKDIANNFYSIPTSKIAYEFTRKVYSLLELDENHIEQNYTSYDIIEENEIIKGEEITINGTRMKFDAIIGNPPYQQKDGGFGTSSAPIYHKFVEQGKSLKPQYLSMVIPARWFSGGKGLDSFRENMLKDKRVREIYDYPEAIDVFPGVQIKGGVCYFLWNRDNEGLCKVTSYKKGEISSCMERNLLEDDAETFIRFNEAIAILKKVQQFSEPSIKDQISARKPYGLNTTFRGKNKKNKNDLLVYQNGGIGYISKSKITKGIDTISKYKVFIPPLGSGSDAFPHPILGRPFVGAPNSICTETYLIAGQYEDKLHAENLATYLKSKFLRFMVLLNKPSQHATSKVYHFVPQQDFTQKWDDKKLYKKYKLTDNEIKFIDSLIKPMD